MPALLLLLPLSPLTVSGAWGEPCRWKPCFGKRTEHPPVLSPVLFISTSAHSLHLQAGWRAGRARKAPADAGPWTGPSPDKEHRGGTSPGRLLSPLDIRLLFFGWGRATLSTRETLAGKGEPGGLVELVAGGGGVLSFIRSMKTIRGLSLGHGGAWGGKPRWAQAGGKQAQV